MSENLSNYATIITKKKIYFVPTCLIIEIMATMYSHMARLPSARLSNADMELLIDMLHRFVNDIHCTSHAYETERVKFFIGDWQIDRSKAEKIFANLMNKVRRIYERSQRPHRTKLSNIMATLKIEWRKLFDILNSKCTQGNYRDRDTEVKYFRSADNSTWRKTMAHILLSLDKAIDSQSDSHLLLVCYTRVKAHLISKIEEIQAKNNIKEKFQESKIICVSDNEICMSCPLCMRFTGEIFRPVRQPESPVNRGDTAVQQVGAPAT